MRVSTPDEIDPRWHSGERATRPRKKLCWSVLQPFDLGMDAAIHILPFEFDIAIYAHVTFSSV
jgi:hypothetical protein